MNNILLDTSFVIALNNPKDRYHPRAYKFVSETKDNLIVPEVALTETAFMLAQAGGFPAVIAFLDRLVETETPLQNLSLNDLLRARQIMAAYPEARFDFVDCCIMSLAERLDIRQICTFDRRDFSIFRPKHCEFLELLP
ncbi:MAG: hypothetical protein BroJett038_15900 [Chloroflexota bacterium]|nr:MAG: hypothetical protein BroJett038_15900 [Chloroflexota bacterium]